MPASWQFFWLKGWGQDRRPGRSTLISIPRGRASLYARPVPPLALALVSPLSVPSTQASTSDTTGKASTAIPVVRGPRSLGP